MKIEQIFLYGLIGIGLITILYVFFADAMDGMDSGILNPTTVTFLSIIYLCIRIYPIKLTELERRNRYYS